MALSYVLVALSLLSLAAAGSPGFGGWQTGRATHYGALVEPKRGTEQWLAVNPTRPFLPFAWTLRLKWLTAAPFVCRH